MTRPDLSDRRRRADSFQWRGRDELRNEERVQEPQTTAPEPWPAPHFLVQ